MKNHNPNQSKTQFKESIDVTSIVQEYMDSLLVDLFPDVIDNLPETNSQEATLVDTVESAPTQPDTTPIQVIDAIDVPVESPVPVAGVTPGIEKQATPVTEKKIALPKEKIGLAKPEAKLQSKTKLEANEAIETKKEALAPHQAPEAPEKVEDSKIAEEPKIEIDVQIAEQSKAKPVELRYPNAPEWAQQTFDVLLFDVCGLKLAVPMESLGKIIKVEHETNHLIGRPNWFIGTYNENEQNLFVVDTARYIMPEKGFNLAENGYDFIIQLQRSQWTLACKKVYSTVRLEPNQVKWRSSQGKRRWLSGTVVDHMCALIHVDSLISLLDTEAS